MKKLSAFIFALGLVLSSSLMAFEPFKVQNIEVEGIQRVSKDAVLRDLPISPGDTLNSKNANEAIHVLYDTGFFKNIEFEREGQTLIVKVIERPSIGSLEVVGLKSSEEVDKILKINNVAEGRIYDPNVISKVEKEIFQKYLTEQRYGVKVETKVTPISRNRVNLEINVYEGNVSTIRQINFVGNNAFTDKKLRQQMFHKTKNLLSWFDKSDHYSKEKLAADMEMIRSFYMDNGYIEFRIESTQVSLSVDKKYVYITISVSEGPQYFFSQSTVAGDMVLDRNEMQTIVDKHIKPGEPFSRKAIWEVKDRIEEDLGEAGYSKADVRIMDDIDQESRKVSIKFYIESNKRITVRRINFEGNTLTQDEVLRRELEQFEGSWISTKKVKEGKEGILRGGYASKVDIETIPVLDKDDQVDLLYSLEEQRNANLSAGISYSGADKLSFNLGADLKNYVGTGKDINFMFNHGKAVQSYSLGYSDPYFTSSGIGFGTNLYRQRTRLSETSDVFDYALNSTGFNMVWQLRLSQYTYLKFGAGYDYSLLKMNYASAPIQMQNFVNAYDSTPVTARQLHIGFREGYASLGLSHSSLDSYLFPSKGLSSSIDLKGSIPGGDIEMYRIDMSSSWFKPIYNPVVLNLRGDAGYAATYNDKPFPFYRNYYLGGGESVRGFEERSLGPRDSQNRPYGGNMIVEGRMQLIFPPPFVPDAEAMRMALFLDAGQVYVVGDKASTNGLTRNPTGIRYSAGVSVTWNTPLQVPIAFSFAWALNNKRNDDTKVFAFSMGTGF